MEDQNPVALPQHKLSLELRSHPERGRGVFATIPIVRNTVVDISPVLHFSHDEYSQHGKYTVLDHYTYRWKDGYALALGLGSMFNHSNHPNVGFIRDLDNGLIRYIATDNISKDEELCISYGSNIWFKNTEAEEKAELEQKHEDEETEEQWWKNMSWELE
ncbi:hypothetical protein CLU79DRAFT_833604 [Phycomyces nitens]|nr:hypothetical protein CLU79DRAFT_833604 [Phycomyces nitens]